MHIFHSPLSSHRISLPLNNPPQLYLYMHIYIYNSKAKNPKTQNSQQEKKKHFLSSLSLYKIIYNFHNTISVDSTRKAKRDSLPTPPLLFLSTHHDSASIIIPFPHHHHHRRHQQLRRRRREQQQQQQQLQTKPSAVAAAGARLAVVVRLQHPLDRSFKKRKQKNIINNRTLFPTRFVSGSTNHPAMDLGGANQPRLVGDYILGPKIGSGSFAVVWRSTHRQTGLEVAVKEIDKKQLNPKISESLLKEISILSTINHPNIIRLLKAIETEDKIYLVLEYCEGGDLAAYINRHERVSEAVARHFMRQLAAGLQVLQEKHLIHRDLKPQNLLLSSNEPIPLLKIGDFGFARSLMPQGLADTLCGSPLYMAPEIIQNKKYDAKADLWSVGAILYQLVTGRPPFEGDSQYQLFQNITSTELQFPDGALEELNPDCVDLCRCLLRRDPVERLPFKEFFSHKFLMEPRPVPDVKQFSLLLPMEPIVEQYKSSASDKRSILSSALPSNLHSGGLGLQFSTEHETIVLRGKDAEGTSSAKSAHAPRKSTDQEPNSSHQHQVSDSMELIEKDYVLVSAHFASLEAISCYREPSLELECKTGAPSYTSEQTEQGRPLMQAKELSLSSVGGAESSLKHEADMLPTSRASTILREVQGLSILHPSTRIQLLHQYVQVLAELSLEKCNAGLYPESFSVELVILAIWKKALQICSTWLGSTTENDEPGSSSANDPRLARGGVVLSPGTEENIDFSRPSCVSMWAEKSFLDAFNRAEKLSQYIRNMDGTAEMPDAMEIIFEKALAYGKSGAVVEFMENNSTAAESYSKALLLLSFIAGEAETLSLKPPFSLTPETKERIQHYITSLHLRQTNFLMSRPSLRQFLDSPSK